MTDYYAVLGVRRDCTEDELKSAFRKAALKYHPDRNKDPRASAQFRLAVDAYNHIYEEILRDPGGHVFKAQKEPDIADKDINRPSGRDPAEESPKGPGEAELTHEERVAQRPLVKLLIRLFIPPLRLIDNLSSNIQMGDQHRLAVKWGFFIAALQIFVMIIIYLFSPVNASISLFPGLILNCLLYLALPFGPAVLALWDAGHQDLLSGEARRDDLFTMARIGFVAGMTGNAPLLLTLWVTALLELQKYGVTDIFFVTAVYIGANTIGIPLVYFFDKRSKR